jgi:hypothetical protein
MIGTLHRKEADSLAEGVRTGWELSLAIPVVQILTMRYR